MRTKNIFKTLVLAAVLVSACGKHEIANNDKGYSLPVTINVTREGDNTKATYNETSKKLEFSAGDQLFVGGNYDDWNKRFAGTLDYDAESGKFKGTIYTQDDTYKTYEDLFGNSDYTIATLLPAGYKDHGYLVINTNDPDAQYDDYIEDSNEYTLATSKADGVAQFSYEKSSYYNDGFALSPENAILNFTITGLAASTSVNVSLTSMAYNITGTVTTDASGTATFAAGIMGGLNLQKFSLTVGGKNITIVSSDKVVEEGKIYNITRSAAPAPVAAPFSVSSTKQVYFAPGNLRAKYKDGTWTWSFSPNQWSYVGNASNNTNINGNGTVSAGGELYVDLFGWVGNSSTVLTGAIAKYGISNSTTSSDYSTVAGEALKSDWSVVANAANLDGHNDWRTLTGGQSGEWKYLLETRSASTVSGTANARYCKATVNSVPGLVLFPDSYTHPTGVTAPTLINYAPAAFTSNSWSGGDWTAMETVGCVFLPAAGYRSGASVSEDGTEGWYWSSTSHAEDAGWAGRLYFWKGDVNGWASKQVYRGHSVRLVRDAN